MPDAANDTLHDERIHGLDVLRAAAMMLGIYLHGAISFMVSEVPWAMKDPRQSILFDISVAAIHGFRMQLFFVLAGFFANLVHRRIGMGPFLQRRALRIGVPFIVGLFTLLPLTFAAWFWGEHVSGQRTDQPVVGTPTSLLDYPTAHLWFLQYLLFFYLIAAVSVRLPLRTFSNRVIALIPGLLRSRSKILLLMLLTTPFLITGPQVGEPESPGISLRMTWNAIGYYGAFFWFGWMMFHARSALDEFKRFPILHLAVGLISFLCYGAVVEELTRNPDATGWQTKLFGNVAVGIYTWAMIFLVTGLTLRWFSRPTRWAQYWADASYWFYLVHLPLVVTFQVIVFKWNLNSFAKCAFVCGASIAVLWLTYHWCVRYTFIGTLLNGCRARPLI